MTLLYNLSILIYSLLVKLASFFNPKAKLWVNGRKNIFKELSEALSGNENIAWFHVSSLGEFEQGRPVIEALRENYPNFKILLTFFSPSGYEVRKNYDGADYICYLPIDTRKNAKQFIELTKPKIAFFVKYDFWYHYLNELNKNHIPSFIFSAIFREQQLFFKWYGAWYRKLLGCFTHLYVQNQQSMQLLQSIGINNVTIGGDTRFDRVYALAKNAKQIPLIEQFIKNAKVVICGSTWEKDEELIAQYASKTKHNIKWIIAPHEIHASHIDKIVSLFKGSVLKFSEATSENIDRASILIIDSIGILSSLYRYGDAAYIGGGFGVGIHNTLEAATYGLPVVFGPNYKRFQEACDLIEQNAGFPIENFIEFESILNSLMENADLAKNSGKNAQNYVEKMRGGTQIILTDISL